MVRVYIHEPNSGEMEEEEKIYNIIKQVFKNADESDTKVTGKFLMFAADADPVLVNLAIKQLKNYETSLKVFESVAYLCVERPKRYSLLKKGLFKMYTAISLTLSFHYLALPLIQLYLLA